MVSSNFFSRLPPTAVILIHSLLSDLTAAHVLPRETKTADFGAIINVLPWPIIPTPAPLLPDQLLRRESNTVCGYIGGDPDLPATCSAGSHCAVDVEHGAIGCCPDGGSCTSGIFTGCVDRNSNPQNVANPYIFTCSGSDVCYKNTFDGGFFQYGCGSASNLATSVAVSASGKPSLDLTTLSVALTATPTTLSEPTTIGSHSSTLSDSSTSQSSTDSDTSTSSEAATTKAAASESAPKPSTTGGAAAAPSNDGSQTKNTGAIVGGTIGGFAVIFALAALGFFLWRRKKGNTRRGPGNMSDSRYISSPMADNQRAFEPIAPSHEVSEAGIPPTYLPDSRNSDGVSATSSDYGIPYQSNYAYGHDRGGAALGARDGTTESDRVPLTRELDDFSHGFNTALEGIEEEGNELEDRPQAAEEYPGPRRGGGSGILWQQNRRRSRNLMWM